MSLLRPSALLCAALLVGCATPRPAGHGAEWHPVPLPGKTATRYDWTTKDGRPALAALAERSASMYRRHVRHTPGTPIGALSFSWWVQDLIEGASVADIEREDAVARVIVGFDGDHRRLPARTRALFELAEALTGEKPPYATLMYVWDATAPVGTVIVNPRSDRIRKIVVDSGTTHLRRWREHRRDLAADFRLAFGEEPGELLSIAVMTDSDNTGARAQSWYGSLALH